MSCRGREIAGPRRRGLLALLADDLRTGCGTARLLDGLWPDEQPENPTKALQVLVSRARPQLGAELIAGTATGYRLTLGEDQDDSSAVVLAAGDSSRAAQDGDHTAALAPAEAGLALWDGGADDLAADPVSALRSARVPAYTTLVRARALSLARLGRRAEPQVRHQDQVLLAGEHGVHGGELPGHPDLRPHRVGIAYALRRPLAVMACSAGPACPAVVVRVVVMGGACGAAALRRFHGRL